MTVNNIMRFDSPMDYTALTEKISMLADRYSELDVGVLGGSILGRKIPILKLGRGKNKALYVGAHHGMEWICATVLLLFVNDVLENVRCDLCACGVSARYLCETASIYVVPMLNPDGVEYSINGVGEDNVLRDRVIRMNGGSEDLSRWQANARGVDLNHNYDAGFAEYKALERELGIFDGGPTRYSGENPESEPEVAAICNLIRSVDFSLLFTLHSQGEEIYYEYEGSATEKLKNRGLAERISSLCGYRLSTPEGAAAYGGLSDWAGGVMGVPSFTFECGVGENPLPITDCLPIYAKIRPVLYSAPLMF